MYRAQMPSEETQRSKEEILENQELKIVENKKTATVDDETEEEVIQNDLEYLLSEKTWREAINTEKVGGADKLIDRLVELGFVKPSKIQSKTISFALIKRDVGIIAQSYNGSGKTLGFVISAVLRIDVSKPLNKSETTYLPQVLITAPTIELCTQIIKIVELIAQPFPEIKVSSGTSAAHIVVRTPKSLLRLIESQEIDLSNIDLVVLDEADEQLKGESGTSVLGVVSKLPKGCGLFFFSATYTQESVEAINVHFAKLGLKFVMRYMLKSAHLKLTGIKQFSKRCEARRKAEYIDELLNSLETDMQIIIFTNTKIFAQETYEGLKAKGHTIVLLMDGQTPEERTNIFNYFKQGKYKILITNLSLRGFDQRTIGFVINLDISMEKSNKADEDSLVVCGSTDRRDIDLALNLSYLHRIGRTGRYGDIGLALNLYTFDDEVEMLNEIQTYYGCEITDISKQSNEDGFSRINKELERVKKNNEAKREKIGEKDPTSIFH